MSIELTLGMAVYDDYDGAVFTSQAAQLYHPEIKEIIFVDNNPTSKQGEALHRFAKQNSSILRYYKYEEVKGTAMPRNKIFEHATNTYVICCDPHVLFPKDSIKELVEFYKKNPNTKDLISGPLLYDNMVNVSTHFNLDKWDGEMWGQWDTDYTNYLLGFPFEIPAQGLGAFSCRKDSWLGFNPRFRGFGGEEGYIHEKYRQAGHKALCIPGFTWWHRFGRPNGVSYTLTRYNKCRNYVIGFRELGLSLKPIEDYFLGHKLMSSEEWKNILEEKEEDVGCGCSKKSEKFSILTSEEWYNKSKDTPSDINEHVNTLKDLSLGTDIVVEFVHRPGISTSGIVAGKPKKVLSVSQMEDISMREYAKLVNNEGNTILSHVEGNSLTFKIPECDLLFLDTKHTGEQVYQELKLHAPNVKKRIAIHDTEIFGNRGEDGSNGLMFGIRQFVYENPEWFVWKHLTNNHGFTILSRLPEEAPPKLPPLWKQAITYAKSEVKDIANGRKRVPLELAQARYDICTSNEGRCPAKARHIAEDRCGICSCYLWNQPGTEKDSQTGKVWRILDSCPLGYWNNAIVKEEEDD